MEWLNYHHLRLFWTTAREGGVSAAARALRLSQPTVSAQLRALEDQLGERLLLREGRGVALTQIGRTVYAYADEIFNLGRELSEALRSGHPGPRARLRVGVADVVPKLVAWKLLRPSLATSDGVRLSCHEDRHDRLVAQLGTHDLDLVLTDHPLGPGEPLRAASHRLGESGVSFLAARALAARLPEAFPAALDGAPFVLPLESSGLRRSLEAWFREGRLTPQIVAECEDSALVKVLGEDGVGIYCVPTLVEPAATASGAVVCLGRAEGVRERYFALVPERRVQHAAIAAILSAARGELPEHAT